MDDYENQEEYMDAEYEHYEEIDDYMYVDNYMDIENNNSPYEVLPQSSVYHQIEMLVEHIKQTVALPFGWSLLLLREFQWQTELLGDYFTNMKKYRKAIGYSEQLLTPEKANKMNKKDECPVCCSEEVLVYNICGEGFCRNCWVGEIQQKLAVKNPFPRCMNDQCRAPLLDETIRFILSGDQKHADVHNKLRSKYEKLLCQCFTDVSRSYQICPGADCTYCIKSQTYGVTTVSCICGTTFCFKCQSDDHAPCTCEEKKKWTEIVLKEEANAKWIAQNTKLCPWCNKAVERSQGCNFMACLCGKSFCYMCSKPWEPDHKDHFKCHVYKKREDDEINKEKAVLEKLNFFAERYLNANGLVINLKKIDVFSKRKTLYQTLGIDLTDSEFIEEAYHFAIDCCQSLKWIYVYSYFVEIINKGRKETFEFTQGQYERYKEELLNKLGIDLKKLLDQIYKQMQMNHKLSESSIKKYTEIFHGLKTNIINYYKSTKTFKQKFIEEIQTLDSNAIRRGNDKEAATPSLKKQESSKESKKGKKK